MAVEKIAGSLDGNGLRIGVVVSRFNEYAGKEEFEACLQELLKLGVAEEDIMHVSVPGALSRSRTRLNGLPTAKATMPSLHWAP